MITMVSIRISDEVRNCLGSLRITSRESYDEVIRRKLKLKRKSGLKSKLKAVNNSETHLKNLITGGRY